MHVVITGANRGIGRALAEHYLAAGQQVTATSRQAGSDPRLDVTDPASHAALSGQLDGRPIDLLICNAGVYADKNQDLASGYPAQMWADTFSANVTGVFLTVQSLLPNLQLSQSPKIAVISSIMASDAGAPGGSYIYRASKAAALNLGRNLAMDLKPLGISVGIYHPGWVRTGMGGTGADIDVETAADGLQQRFAALGPATTGCFEDYAGRAIPY